MLQVRLTLTPSNPPFYRCLNCKNPVSLGAVAMIQGKLYCKVCPGLRFSAALRTASYESFKKQAATNSPLLPIARHYTSICQPSLTPSHPRLQEEPLTTPRAHLRIGVYRHTHTHTHTH